MLWVKHSKKEQERENYEGLVESVTQTRFTQKVFLAWREATNKDKQARFMIKFDAWKNWCEMMKN